MEQQVEYSARASLVTIGMRFRRLSIWATVGEHVKIKQKVLTHTSLDKLLAVSSTSWPVERAWSRSTPAYGRIGRFKEPLVAQGVRSSLPSATP